MSPITAAISRLSSGLPVGRAGRLFSKRPVSLRSSGLDPFGAVLEIRTFVTTYEVQRNEVLPLLSDRRERLISSSPYRGPNPVAPAGSQSTRDSYAVSPIRGAQRPGVKCVSSKSSRFGQAVVQLEIVALNSLIKPRGPETGRDRAWCGTQCGSLR